MNNTSVLTEGNGVSAKLHTVLIIRLDKLNFPCLSKDPYKHPGVFPPVIGRLEILLRLVLELCVTVA